MTEGEGSPNPHGQTTGLFRMPGGLLRTVFTLALIALLGWGGAKAWKRWGVAAMQSPQYKLTAEQIQTSPLPPWIRTNVVEEILRDGSLEQHSILDPQLTIKVADAFRLHPWVRSVVRVRKRSPGHVIVDLEFRQPVALVEVVTANARGVLPVDADGVLLPRADFVNDQGELHEDALSLPVIAAGDSIPQGPVGSSWGDARVRGAARVAAAFGKNWKATGLFKIEPDLSSCGPSNHAECEFTLLAKNGSRVIWGKAPGDSPSEQLAAEEKAGRLLQHAAQSHAFEASASPTEVDLRSPGDLRIVPSTARQTSTLRP